MRRGKKRACLLCLTYGGVLRCLYRPAPQTGDRFPLGAALALLAMSGAALALIAVRQRKHSSL